jgi:hypothetical protein
MNMGVLHLQHMDTLSFHLKCTAETSKLITVFHTLLPENDVVWRNNRDFEGLVRAYPSSDSRLSYDVTWETPTAMEFNSKKAPRETTDILLVALRSLR